MSSTTNLLQLKIKDIPELQPVRRGFYTFLTASIICGCLGLSIMLFAPQLFVPKLLLLVGMLYSVTRVLKISSAWSVAVHDQYTVHSQKLLNMCLAHSHQQVKSWLDTPDLQPWAQHVLEQYLKNYATAAA